ncbi:MAG: response regulator [Candidatus Doudnabacteria bacterium]
MTDTSNKKILIVEDEMSQRKALVDKFTREGFQVVSARDGEEGLSTALKEKPDLILLDIVMPKMDGMTMLKKLRQENEWSKTVPVIMLTNLSADDDKIMKGVTEDLPSYYLVKSNWAINDVVEKVKDRLSQ